MNDIDNDVSNLPKDTEKTDITLERIEQPHHHHGKLYVNAKGKSVYKKVKHRHKHTSRKNKSKTKLALKVIIGILIFLIVLVLGLTITYFTMKGRGKKDLLKDNENVSISAIDDAITDNSGKTVIYNGKTYTFNTNIMSIVFLGIDQDTLGTTTFGEAGQADAVYIFTYDTVTKKACIIPVSRETMTDIDVYSSSKSYIGTKTEQLCLSYAYGDGQEFSCQNTLKALSRLFYNIPFSNYISVNWNVIVPLNNKLNGVLLTSLEDIDAENTHIKKGETINLLGDDAFYYVKYRNYLEDNTNKDRMARQKQYVSAYFNQLLPYAKKDISVISDLYKIAQDYMVSNITTSEIVYIASDILPSVYSSKDIPFKNIKGKTNSENTNDEFYPNQRLLYETILDVFYTEQQ